MLYKPRPDISLVPGSWISSEMSIIPRAVEIRSGDDLSPLTCSELVLLSPVSLALFMFLSNYSVQTTWEILRKLNNATKKCHASLSIVTLCFYFNKNPKHFKLIFNQEWSKNLVKL